MKLHAEFKPDGIDDFSHILKGLKDFSSFAVENSFLCFKFSEKYLYIFGNEKNHVEIFIKINMDDLFYDNFILKSATNNQIIILVYIFQIYDIFKNVSKSTKITIDLFDKNGICILLFKHQCSVTDALKKFECGIELINPSLTAFPNVKVNKNAFSINCKLKKCCKILNTYSKFQSEKVELNFHIANKHCDVVFLLDSITTTNVTTLKNNYVLKDFMDKQAKQEKDQNNGNFNLKKVIYIKTLTKALNILNECRNNKDDVGIFKIIVPYNKCWFALKLGQFESSGNWKVLIVITDLSLDL
ncbi:conserved Plasmodium protein, unknown function [Plasmodium knowlesi strain H]|uniref:Uncharacterized protein n=3 Tax=Plasmodium knowlesi TaxID=5850 RepID=A0A5K1VA66_PLAKH|nr:conserved Plasmodium protein, unknown function [Plasmodium knowlesi strain H]OTN64325.1 Uncharacterized protein PKNOH_S130187800 [Plasmodium knowlesi]CAA9989041.1 conserved Plasmodium protein, unknown function [Plasmodium knowlesi strain H]SBO27251.1 conserved Plasmodium protein, unknown function [Plasmodium knowlesi strain H]SBO28882.1 conserved Plasmodium protein, unknown function [Plasmodium knowlesi strain H]VVS78515.1 conserved Plasmodium protein, unknown function [Plasmodium knowlesi |eukprot:XP_002261390.1 hypothetical protein, conserved in Plasmodium species [Plasmodium knowlesi strain H]